MRLAYVSQWNGQSQNTQQESELKGLPDKTDTMLLFTDSYDSYEKPDSPEYFNDDVVVSLVANSGHIYGWDFKGDSWADWDDEEDDWTGSKEITSDLLDEPKVHQSLPSHSREDVGKKSTSTLARLESLTEVIIPRGGNSPLGNNMVTPSFNLVETKVHSPKLTQDVMVGNFNTLAKEFSPLQITMLRDSPILLNVLEKISSTCETLNSTTCFGYSSEKICMLGISLVSNTADARIENKKQHILLHYRVIEKSRSILVQIPDRDYLEQVISKPVLGNLQSSTVLGSIPHKTLLELVSAMLVLGVNPMETSNDKRRSLKSVHKYANVSPATTIPEEANQIFSTHDVIESPIMENTAIDGVTSSNIYEEILQEKKTKIYGLGFQSSSDFVNMKEVVDNNMDNDLGYDIESVDSLTPPEEENLVSLLVKEKYCTEKFGLVMDLIWDELVESDLLDSYGLDVEETFEDSETVPLRNCFGNSLSPVCEESEPEIEDNCFGFVETVTPSISSHYFGGSCISDNLNQSVFMAPGICDNPEESLVSNGTSSGPEIHSSFSSSDKEINELGIRFHTRSSTSIDVLKAKKEIVTEANGNLSKCDTLGQLTDRTSLDGLKSKLAHGKVQLSSFLVRMPRKTLLELVKLCNVTENSTVKSKLSTTRKNGSRRDNSKRRRYYEYQPRY